jgi:hypothetical protein
MDDGAEDGGRFGAKLDWIDTGGGGEDKKTRRVKSLV